MSIPAIKPAFTLGELAPSLWGRTDLARYSIGASTMRNMWPSYHGGAYSRAGTAFVGFSKQTGRGYPPRMVPFQFNIKQGLALEFGHQYMRVISEGAYVTEPGIAITDITRADPGVLTVSAFAAASAVANNGGVSSSYRAGDQITLAGGSFSQAAVLGVVNTSVIALSVNSPGSGASPGVSYAPGDIIFLAGGTYTAQGQVSVSLTKVINAAINTQGSGGTPGTQIVNGTTGTGTKFQAQVTINGSGHMVAVNSITLAGSYSVNPTNLTHENVTGAGLSGASLVLSMGVAAITISSGGAYTVNPVGAAFTQASSSGVGSGATFISALMGIGQLSVINGGVYSSFPANPVLQGSTTGTGLGATFNVTTTNASSFATGDWVYLSGISGMTELNGDTVVLVKLSPTTFAMRDVYGNNIDTSAFGNYTGGGLAERVYTLSTPYNEDDLPWLKWGQSADVMSICCVNQDSGDEYQPQDLTRFSDTDWRFSPVVPAPSVLPPPALDVSKSDDGDIGYGYVVTSVAADGTESVASVAGYQNNAVNIAAEAGTITVRWIPVDGVKEYFVYKASPVFGGLPPVGSAFGFAGNSFGNVFTDSNIIPDLSQTPPLHANPFASGQVVSITITSGGAGYSPSTISASIISATGFGAVLQPVTQSGVVSAIIVVDPGQGYQPGDVVVISGSGTGATATARIGPQTGTYPGTVAYFQQRRAYAFTLNNPDTYFMSQPGAFTNFDSRIPTIASDAIIGSPWSIQVNGIQFMVPMPGGLVVLTGVQAWQLTGAGGSSLTPTPITPSSQEAQPQAYNGCSPTVPPIRIGDDLLYVQAKGSIVRDLSYQLYANVYTGDDLTVNSSHLFTGYTVKEWAWCEEPFKIVWAVRNDGVLLSLTFLKGQQIAGWARHDTNGLFQSCCTITELPVDALYLAVQRFPGGRNAYMIERMNDRFWDQVEDCWCVDSGLSLPQPTPDAVLTANSATGLGACTGVTGLIGGSGYSAATTAEIVDDNGQGSGTGSVVALTIVGGVITVVSFPSQGSGYVAPKLVIFDPENSGSGAGADVVLDNSATFTASAPVFSLGSLGSVIRVGGGIAVITAYTNPTTVTANILSPITALIPNSGGIVLPQVAGNWTMTAPVTTIGGLQHLSGAIVTGLADGNIVTPRVVSATGQIMLDAPASAVTVGLGFQAQLQSVYLDTGEPTIQGQRKKIAAVTARIQLSRDLLAGANQLDGSIQSPPELAPVWPVGAGELTITPNDGPNFPPKPYNAIATPLRTGDIRVPLSGGFATKGQVCFQQSNPLPMVVLAAIAEDWAGDMPQVEWPKQGRS